MKNPVNFKVNDFIKSVYSGKIYQVIEPNKRGMAELLNTETGWKEDWNSCNNPHFIKQEAQLNLFSPH